MLIQNYSINPECFAHFCSNRKGGSTGIGGGYKSSVCARCRFGSPFQLFPPNELLLGAGAGGITNGTFHGRSPSGRCKGGKCADDGIVELELLSSSGHATPGGLASATRSARQFIGHMTLPAG
jgi:hypothetical protein